MTNQDLRQAAAELAEMGWRIDDTPQGAEMPLRFPSFTETVNYLIDLGKTAQPFAAVPTVHIDGGTEVTLRLGRPPAPGLTADEIALAKAIHPGRHSQENDG